MPVAIHCEPVTEPHSLNALLGTRWIAASLAALDSRNDTVLEWRSVFVYYKIGLSAKLMKIDSNSEKVRLPTVIFSKAS